MSALVDWTLHYTTADGTILVPDIEVEVEVYARTDRYGELTLDIHNIWLRVETPTPSVKAMCWGNAPRIDLLATDDPHAALMGRQFRDALEADPRFIERAIEETADDLAAAWTP